MRLCSQVVFNFWCNFLGVWAPMLEPEKSQWEDTSASDLQIFISLFWLCGLPYCTLKRASGSSCPYVVFTSSIIFWPCGLSYWTLKRANGRWSLQVVFKPIMPLFGHVSSHVRSWKEPLGSHIHKWDLKQLVNVDKQIKQHYRQMRALNGLNKWNDLIIQARVMKR